MLKNIRITLGALMALFLVLFGAANLISPVVPESYIDQNTRICIMMIFTGLVAAFAIFRPLTGGVLLSICAFGLGYIFHGFFRNPMTPAILLVGAFFIFAGYRSRRKPKEESEEKGKYANLTTNQLQKRKKYASILLVILIAAVVLDGAILIYGLVTGKGFNNSLFAAAAACILIFIPIYLGKKKIEEELKNMEGN